tara:strand:- start:5 stop:403 length:399 start_codon:yes stop_codon:yes gene_type:complete
MSAVLTLALSGCSRFFEAAGHQVFLATEVSFMDADQKPIVDAVVYVVESIGTMHPITEVLHTNERGRILLKGPYCLPIIVATKGGNIAIQQEALTSSYRAVVERDDPTTLEQLFGQPEDKYMNYSRIHTGCG